MELFDTILEKLNEMGAECGRTTDENGADIIGVSIKGDNYPPLFFQLFLNSEANAQIICFDVCRFSDDKRMDALKVVNKLNADYRWVKFWANDDGKIVALVDVFCHSGLLPEYIMSDFGLLLKTLDEAYPVLNKELAE